jgi:hypothetical protein
MLKTILITLLISATVLLQAQKGFHVSATYATQQGAIDREVAPTIAIRNLSNRTLELRWEIKKTNLSEGWQAVVCDHQCYTPLVQTRTFRLQPNEVLHDFKVSFRPNGKEGMGHVALALYVEGAKSSSQQIVTFSGAAKSSQSNIAGLGHENGVPKIYPNPVTEFMYLKDDYDAVKTVEVYNVVGRQLQRFSVSYSGQKYDVSRLPRGIYMVRMLDESGNIIRTQRVSKYNP